MSRLRALATVVALALLVLLAAPTRGRAAQRRTAPQESDSIESSLLARIWDLTPSAWRTRVCRVTKLELCGQQPGQTNDPGDAGCVIDPSGHCVKH